MKSFGKICMLTFASIVFNFWACSSGIPDRNLVYITNSDGNPELLGGGTSVSVLDRTDDSIIDTVTVESEPRNLRASPNGDKVYVVNKDSDSISVVNTATHTVTTTIDLSGEAIDPRNVIFHPTQNLAYVVGDDIGVFSSLGPPIGKILEINTSTDSLTGEEGGPFDGDNYGIAITPDGSTILITSSLGDVIYVDPTDLSVTSVNFGTQAMGIALTPDGSLAYVTGFPGIASSGRVVRILDIATETFGFQFFVGGDPTDVAITPDGSHALFANQGSNNLIILNLGNLSIDTVDLGQLSYSVDVSPDGETAYVSQRTAVAASGAASQAISVVDLTADPPELVDSIELGQILTTNCCLDGVDVF